MLQLSNEPLPGAVQLQVTPDEGVELATIVTVGLLQVVVTDGDAMLTVGATVLAVTATLALPTHPFTVLVMATEQVPPNVTVGVGTDVPVSPGAAVQV